MLAVPDEAPVPVDVANDEVVGILELGELLREGPRGRLIDLGGGHLADGMVGSYGVEPDPEDIELFLLASEVFFRRSSRFVFEGLVHTLVSAVLAGPSWLDADRMDAELEPPHRQSGQAVQAR